MKIKHKLFIVILTVTGIVLAANFALARWSFDSGFRDFVNGLERERLQSIGRYAIQIYVDANENWNEVKHSSSISGLRLLMDGPSGHAPPYHPLPPPRHRPTPPPMDRFLQPHARERRLEGKERENLSLGGLLPGPPTALFDSNGNWLMGASSEKFTGKPYTSWELFNGDKKIGVLRSWPNPESPLPLANNFSRQQLFGSLIVGLLSVLIAGFIAWWAAKRLTRPIDQVRAGVADLAAGNYELKFEQARTDELGLLMENLESLATTLDKGRSAKKRFFADISHELRTPLTILTGEVASLKAGLREFDDKQLESFEHEIDRLSHLVSDLYQLSVSDLGGMSYHFSRVNLSDCLLQVLDSFKLKFDNKGLELDVLIAPEVYVPADTKRIKQLFLNLCANSINYTDTPGKIRFELTQTGTDVWIVVNDTKPGASIEECALLMEPLYRQDESRTRSESGSGLGLAICKNIVEAHKGNISIRPSSMGGLCTSILLKPWTDK